MRPLLVAILLVAAAVAWAWFDAENGVDTWRRLHHEVEEARARGRSLAERNEALRSEIDALAGDRFAQERAVREELRWVRPGEILIRVPRSDALGGGSARPPLP